MHSDSTLFQLLNGLDPEDLSRAFPEGIELYSNLSALDCQASIQVRDRAEYYIEPKDMTLHVEFVWPANLPQNNIGSEASLALRILTAGTQLRCSVPLPDDTQRSPTPTPSSHAGSDGEESDEGGENEAGEPVNNQNANEIDDESDADSISSFRSFTSVLGPEGWLGPETETIGTLTFHLRETELVRLCSEYNSAYSYGPVADGANYNGNLTNALTHFVHRAAETLAPRGPVCSENEWGVLIRDNTHGQLEGEMVSVHDELFTNTLPLGADQAGMPGDSVLPGTHESVVLFWELLEEYRF